MFLRYSTVFVLFGSTASACQHMTNLPHTLLQSLNTVACSTVGFWYSTCWVGRQYKHSTVLHGRLTFQVFEDMSTCAMLYATPNFLVELACGDITERICCTVHVLYCTVHTASTAHMVETSASRTVHQKDIVRSKSSRQHSEQSVWGHRGRPAARNA